MHKFLIGLKQKYYKLFSSNESMLEKLMLKREQFPLDVLNEKGELIGKSGMSIIPPLHPHIVVNDIDLNLIQYILEEVEENTNLDREECQTRKYLNYENRKIILGPMDVEEGIIRFPKYKEGLCVEPTQITPFGGDGGIYLKQDSATGVYLFPNNLSDELVREYNMLRLESWGSNYFEIQRGWWPHNIDTRDILIKNVVIALNNLIVKQIYSK